MSKISKDEVARIIVRLGDAGCAAILSQSDAERCLVVSLPPALAAEINMKSNNGLAGSVAHSTVAKLSTAKLSPDTLLAAAVQDAVAAGIAAANARSSTLERKAREGGSAAFWGAINRAGFKVPTDTKAQEALEAKLISQASASPKDDADAARIGKLKAVVDAAQSARETYYSSLSPDQRWIGEAGRLAWFAFASDAAQRRLDAEGTSGAIAATLAADEAARGSDLDALLA